MKIGAFSFGAANLTLADIVRAESSAPKPTRQKSIINIFLGGGPPHQDTWDLKPDAPVEIRGEFKPISTKVSGIQIGEMFPKIASMMDRFSLVRSIVGARGGHDGIQCLTGMPEGAFKPLGGWPSMGAILSKLKGPVDPAVPPFVGLAARCGHMPWADEGKPGFLGAAHAAFKPEGQGMSDMRLNGINRDQIANRKRLLTTFDRMRGQVESSEAVRGMDFSTQRALGVLTSSRLLEALDLSQESQKTRDRYGDGKPYKYQFDGAPTVNDQLLMARRLIEAGARCVTLTYGRWDAHSKNFDLVRDHGPKLDQGLTALIEDLEVRGMLEDTTVIAWGEMGRTPRINKEGGRDHWPQVLSAIVAGGGIRGGTVVGSTDRLGEQAKDRPVTFGDMFATLWQSMGIDPDLNPILDPTGRPQHLAEGRVIRELV